MRHRFCSPALVGVGGLILFLACGSWCGGQETESSSAPPAAAQQEQASQRPKRDAFRKMAASVEQKRTALDKLFANMPVGFPELQQQQLEKISALRKEVLELESKIHRAAYEAFLEAPNTDSEVNQAIALALTRSLVPKSTAERFDPQLALDVATSMIQNGIAGPAVYSAAFRAAFALQDFDLARQMLDNVKDNNANARDSAYQELEATRVKWERELALRAAEAAADDLPRVEFNTSAGTFIVELFEDHAPNTVANFLQLAEEKYYDDTIFYKVFPGVLAQAGCPKGDGTSDPGFDLESELERPEIRHHFLGTISMAVDQEKVSGDKFFFAAQPNASLDGKFTVFGRILEQPEIVYEFKTVNRTQPGSQQDEATRILSVRVLSDRKRDHPYSAKRNLRNGDSDNDSD